MHSEISKLKRERERMRERENEEEDQVKECVMQVWFFHRAPVRLVIDSLSGSTERPAPVNLFSKTRHPYL